MSYSSAHALVLCALRSIEPMYPVLQAPVADAGERPRLPSERRQILQIELSLIYEFLRIWFTRLLADSDDDYSKCNRSVTGM